MVIKITIRGAKREISSTSLIVLVMHPGTEQHAFDGLSTIVAIVTGTAKGANDFPFEFKPFDNKLG